MSNNNDDEDSSSAVKTMQNEESINERDQAESTSSLSGVRTNRPVRRLSPRRSQKNTKKEIAGHQSQEEDEEDDENDEHTQLDTSEVDDTGAARTSHRKRKRASAAKEDDDNNDDNAGDDDDTDGHDNSQMHQTKSSVSIGTTISKRFGSKMYDGKVVEGPFDILDDQTGEVESHWKVRYSDGDEEDLSTVEIMKWSTATEKEKANKSSARGPGRKKKVARNGATKDSDAEGNVSGDTPKKGAKKKAKSERKRSRGPLTARTCPKCNRVFTSPLGLKYHVDNNVCQRPNVSRTYKKRKRDGAEGTLFPKLNPGEKFVTTFGVVEVLNDDRGTPTDVAPPTTLQKRQYGDAANKFEKKMVRSHVSRSISLRVRRDQINQVYETHLRRKTQESFHQPVLDGRSVARAYFANNQPSSAASSTWDGVHRTSAPPKDLMAPESLPDRIVECTRIPDKRNRDENESTDEAATTDIQSNSLGHKMYLRRRLLVTPYDESQHVFTCVDCGKEFASPPGLSYHEKTNACGREAMKASQKREAIRQKIDDGASKQISALRTAPLKRIEHDGNIQQLFIDRPNQAENSRTTRMQRKAKRIKEKRILGLYPEILVSLGFTLKKKGRDAKKIIEGAKALKGLEETPDDGQVQRKSVPKVENPYDVFNELQHELEAQRRLEDDLNIGSLYEGTYKSLGFRQHTPFTSTPKPKRIRKISQPKPAVEEKEMSLSQAVDVRALFDEVENGRYPSMTRFDGQHKTTCVGCKQSSGELFKCSYCANVEHVSCLRERHFVKDPEPDEPFFCHLCLSVVVCRRTRAERRRVGKIPGGSQLSQAKQKDRRDQSTVTTRYHALACKGQEMKELSELLRDAKGRLKDIMAAGNVNRMRQRMIDNNAEDF